MPINDYSNSEMYINHNVEMEKYVKMYFTQGPEVMIKALESKDCAKLLPILLVDRKS
jgi:hypothetical protein